MLDRNFFDFKNYPLQHSHNQICVQSKKKSVSKKR